MKVSANARLLRDDGTPVVFQASPNHGGLLRAPTAIVVHYTGGHGLQQSADWLCNRKAKASALCIVGRASGEVIQLVSADRVAWHAGESSWQGRERVNDWSYGIEFENYGKLRLTAKGWGTYFGEPVADIDVFIDANGDGWHTFTEDQILSGYEVCEALIDHAPTIDTVIGHSDVKRTKSDPGPAFPLEQFRSWLLTRGES